MLALRARRGFFILRMLARTLKYNSFAYVPFGDVTSLREFKESVESEEVECCHIYVLAHPVCCFEALINSCGLQLSTRQTAMEVYVFCLYSARAGKDFKAF